MVNARDSMTLWSWLLGSPILSSRLPQDMGGVIDTELRVYGVEALRVVDSSIMPLIPQANIQTTVHAVAEKAADLIKQSYGL